MKFPRTPWAHVKPILEKMREASLNKNDDGNEAAEPDTFCKPVLIGLGLFPRCVSTSCWDSIRTEAAVLAYNVVKNVLAICQQNVG